jgi:diacylglycerol kinase family enzyme
MRSFTVFLNKGSGSVKPEETMSRIEEILRGAGAQVRVERWAVPGADEKVEEAVRRGDTVVAGGGDGTIAGVASHLIGTNALFGVLPLGTLNHFAKDLAIPLDLNGAVQNLLTGTPKKVDTARVNDLIFLNNSSLGLYPKLVQYREHLQKKGHSKWIAFVKAFFYILRKYSSMKISFEIDGKKQTRRTPLAFVGNNEYTLEGWSMGTRKSLCEDCLLVVISTAKKPWKFFTSAISALFGIPPKDSLELIRVSKVTIATHGKTAQVSADGEVHQLHTPLQYEVLPLSLTVIVPNA